MTIILLNFLIALISQKYEEAIAKLDITKTKHKAELNSEFYVDQKNTLAENQRGRIFILQMNTQKDQDGPEWNGVTRSI